MFILDYKAKVPFYEQIQNQVIRFIALELLSPNDQLPAVRALASDLGINPNTVQKAYQELERLGYIYSRMGKGSFISPKQDSLALAQKVKLEELMTLLFEVASIGISKAQVDQLVLQVFQKGVTHDSTE